MVGGRTETRRPGATSGRRPRRAVRSTAVVALALIGLLATVASRAPAGAALTSVGGACGFHLGPPLETGAAGTLGFEFPAYPTDPHQVCSVTVTGQASLDPAAGPAFTNVAGNHGTATFTLRFTGGQLPPGILWLWRPHCADPAAAAVVTLAIDGQTASSSVQPPGSCLADLGGSSTLSFDFVVPSFAYYVVGLAPTHDGHGYWGVWPSGNVRGVGDATQPSPLVDLAATVVGTATDPSGGLWVVGADGGVFALGGAPFLGSLGGRTLNAPVVGMAATPDGGGYWLVSADGGVFAFGDATFFGSMAGSTLNGPVVGMATPDSGGYWLAAHDGGVFAFGDATFEGSAGALDLVAPAFSMAGTPSGHGYWLSGADGGIFAYGDAGFFGTIPSQ